MKICIKTPMDCTASELSEFEALVRAGGEVIGDGLLQRILGASHLVFLRDDSGELAGISALKRPPLQYREHIFSRAQATVPAAQHPVEFGWSYIVPAHRGKGLSRLLVATRLSYTGGDLAYATVRADNEPPQRALARHGFEREGIPWRSTRGEKNLVLLIQRGITK
jgi:RimJ/RimL family protein N-acetyltransferase